MDSKTMDSKQQTLRMTGLPPSTKVDDVVNFFHDRIKRQGRQIIESIGPISQDAMSQKMQTTVSFSSRDAAKQALELEHASRRLIALSGGAEYISLNHNFEDITTLHTSANPVTGHPDIDVVALHGLTGHAWNTFTTSEVVDKHANRTKENNWLRDSLPELLKQNHPQRIYSRVMSFGYNADVWMTKSVADLDDPVKNLLHYLELERRQDPSRPLFFIGHSLGGIVIKQTIVALADEAMKQTIDPNSPSEGHYIFPVKGCMFFGVPHKGADIADKASGFLSVLGSIFNVNRNNIRDLRPKSQRFANISSQFRSVQSEHNIPVISFFETVKYNHAVGLVVQKESAIYDYYGCPNPFAINRDHKDMAKFSNDDDHALKPAIYFLATIASDAIELRNACSRPKNAPPPPPGPVNGEGHAVEDRLSILEDYDTVFLIDDSPSMQGRKWELVQEILNYSTVMATRYDKDGIDIHFMNNTTANQDNVKDPDVAAKIHRGIELKGSTPTLARLARHLNGYLQKFQAADFSADFKCYNLIVLTDGEPNSEYEDEIDISDQEDAKKNKAAFRLIRKKIVKVARKLDEKEVEPRQVGIQFCQIGNDRDATAFFEYLDDQLKGRHNLGRDMVDTIRCQSELDLTDAFYEKLLLGAVDNRLDHTKIEAHHSSKDDGDNVPALPHRSKTEVIGKGKARQWSDDETVVASPIRGNPLPANRSATMQTLHESPTDYGGPLPTFENRPMNITTSRDASSPSAGSGPLPRHTTSQNDIQEAEEPGPRAIQPSTTSGSHRPHWWNR